MKCMRSFRLFAAGSLLLGLTAIASAAPNNGGNDNNGKHNGWDNDDGGGPTVSVPEPDTILLLGTALAIGLVARRRRKK